MKKLRIGLSALAVAIAMGGVFASNAASVQSDDPIYNWITFDESGQQTGIVNGKTQAEMISLTNCSTQVSNICAEALDPSTNVPQPSANLYHQ